MDFSSLNRIFAAESTNNENYGSNDTEDEVCHASHWSHGTETVTLQYTGRLKVKGIDTGTADIIVTCANMPQKYYFLDHDYATATLKVHVTGSTLQLQSGEKSQSDAEARELEW